MDSNAQDRPLRFGFHSGGLEPVRKVTSAAHIVLTFCLIGLLIVGLVGCSGVAVFATFQPYGSTVTISGIVSIVQITSIQGSTGITTVTVVTFVQPGTASTINFCGNLGNQFPVNTFATVTFTQSQGCGNVVTVLLG